MPLKIKKKTKPESSPVTNMTPNDVQLVSVTKLKCWSKNPRKNDKAAKDLAKVLKVHGQRSPIVVWKKNMTVYKGNTTLKAAKILGWDVIATVFVSFPSEAAAAAYAIADNKSSEFAGWDDDLLRELMNVEEMDSFTSALGFSSKEIKALELGAEQPDQLPDVSVSGTVEGENDTMIIAFLEEGQIDEVRKKAGLKETQRVISYDKLMEVMEWR